MKGEVRTITTILIAVGLVLIIGSFFNFATGRATGTVSITVTNSTTISLTTSTVAFADLAVGASNNTTNGNPGPFIVRNDGNVNLNISISADDLWTSESVPSDNYQASCGNTSEWNCSSVGNDIMSFTNVPTSATVFIYNLSYVDANDQAEIEINISVPSAEDGGSKSSTMTVTAGTSGV